MSALTGHHANRIKRHDYTLAVNLGIPALGALSSVLLARSLGPSERGDLAITIAIPTILATVSSLGMSESLAYFTALTEDKRRHLSYLRTASTIAGIGSLVGGICAAVLLTIFRLNGDQDPLTSNVLPALFIPAITIVLIGQGWFRGTGDLRLWNALRLLPTLLWTFAVTIVAVTAPDLSAMAGAFGLSAAAAALVAGATVLRRVKSMPTKVIPSHSTTKQLISFGLPSAASALPRVLNVRLDQVVLIVFVTSQDVGLYVTAVAWTTVIPAIGSAAAMRDFTSLVPLDDSARRNAIRATYRQGLLVSLGTAGVLAIVTIPAYVAVFGKEYESGIPLALAMLPAGVLLSLMNVSTTMLWASGLPRNLLATDVIALTVTIALLSSLSPAVGVYGAVVATSCAYGTAVAYAMRCLFRRHHPVERNPADTPS